MRILRDHKGRFVRLSDERLSHIMSHLELTGHEDWVAETLLHPEEIRYSVSDQSVRLFYRFYPDTMVGGKWLCVVVKYPNDDAFIITAYLTDKIKKGDLIWGSP